ncbi:MAG: hypothetical protein ACTHMW_03815 [Actinomycetes bacterium]
MRADKYTLLREKARELRRQGKSYKEIGNELQVARSTCSVWCRDLPYPDFSARSWRTRHLVDPELGDAELQVLAHHLVRAGAGPRQMLIFPQHIRETVDLRRQDLPQLPPDRSEAACWLRARGWSIPEIARTLEVGASAVSRWCTDRGELPRGEARGGTADGLRQLRKQASLAGCRGAIGALDEREVLLLGLVAYMCEGAKNKPWGRTSPAFSNTDVRLIRLWLDVLELMGVAEDRLRYSIQIHETADAAAAMASWAEDLGVSVGRFNPPVMKRHNPRTPRRRVGSTYRGCLTVRVTQGGRLLDLVEDAFQAVSEAADVARRARSCSEQDDG